VVEEEEKEETTGVEVLEGVEVEEVDDWGAAGFAA